MAKIIKQYLVPSGSIEINDKIYRLSIQGYPGLQIRLGTNSTYTLLYSPENVFEITEEHLTSIDGSGENYIAGLSILGATTQDAPNLVIIDALVEEN